ncbi:MAG: hypothetical protein KF798_04040 [Candidatus Paracaedibacteraceae bacterium]|nr:hypothetical protein [Candidatus Paracaedibacteraceae bacterium]
MTAPYLSPLRYTQLTALQNERDYQNFSAEMTSGGISSGYGDIQNVSQFINQELILHSIQNYQESATLNKERMSFVSNQMGTLRDIAVELQTRVSLLRSSPLAKPQELMTWAHDKLDQLTSLLNGRFDGKYLMSGTATNIAAVVDLGALPAVGTSDPVDLAYYQGNTQNIAFRADDHTVVETPVRADDTGISELIFALRLCANIPSSDMDERLARANDLALQAHEDMVVTNSKLDSNLNILLNIQDELLELEQSLTENIKEIGYRTQAQVLQDYMQSKSQLELTRFVTTSQLNSIKDLITQMK